VRHLPPLIVAGAEVAEAVNKLDAACVALEAQIKAAERGAAE
jgi:acetylornithine/succinyldiaminopimelate/putrescine aminotransferase